MPLHMNFDFWRFIMEMRTRILGKMLNSEVQDYLKRNDIIIVPVGSD